jgi:DNA-binding NtrC family response regulator
VNAQQVPGSWIARPINRGFMSRRTVLLVDQNENLLARLGEVIAAAGYQAVVCGCFEEGRCYLNRETPDAIVTGLRLGAFNGLHLVLFAKQKAPGIAAIVYSGRADSGIGRDAASTGATYLDEETLLATLIPLLNTQLLAVAGGSLAGSDTTVASPA